MSDFNVLAVRSGESDDSPHYPIPGEVPDSIELTEEDGQPLATLTATELTLSEIKSTGLPRRLVHVEKMKAAIIITDARVAIACSKYEKGGGWTPWTIGALPVAVIANTTSKLKAARRRRGKMLVGHVRYLHLNTVGFRRIGTLKQRDQLRLGTYDHTADGNRRLLLDITLAGGQSASALSQQIVSRAATHRLESEDGLDEGTRRSLEALRTPQPLPPQGKDFASYFLLDGSTGSA